MSNDIFSPLEIDTIGEIMNISMGSAATAASTLLDKKVNITTPVVNVVSLREYEIAPLIPAVAVEITYVEGISGSNILILRQKDVRTILSQMMMTEIPEDQEIDEIAESAICELMNQMMGSSATVLSCFLGRTINISTPSIVPIDKFEDFKTERFPGENNIITIMFNITIEGIMESEFVSVMEIDLAKEIISTSLNFDTTPSEEAMPQKSPAAAAPLVPDIQPSAPPPPQAPLPETQQQAPPAPAPQADPGFQPPPYEAYPPYQAPAQPYQMPPQPYPGMMQQPYPGMLQQPYQFPQPPMPPQGYGYPAAQAAEQQPIVVKDYNYSDFGHGPAGGEQAGNLDLVLNVPVMVTVELGRTHRKIKEILEFGQGTIVNLEKQAGSQVDLIVNGQMIAHGDVVVVDDNFSIRITEILKNRDSIGMP